MFQLLVANLHRVHTLILRPCKEEWLRRLHNVPAPQLKVLVWDIAGLDLDLGEDPVRPDIIPKLRHLELAWFSRRFGFLPCSLPTVTNLTLFRSYRHGEPEILRRCTSVRTLTILGVRSTWDIAPELIYLSPSPHVLTNLMHLTCDGSALPMLASLDSPTLRINFNMFINRSCVVSTPQKEFSSLARLLELFTDPNRTNPRLDHFSLTFDHSSYRILGESREGNPLISIFIYHSFRDRWEDTPSGDTPVLQSLVRFIQTMSIPAHTMDVRGRIGGSLPELFYLLRGKLDVPTIRLPNGAGKDVLIGFLSLPNGGDPPCALELQLPPPSLDFLQNPFDERLASMQKKQLRFCKCSHCHDVRMTSFPDLKVLILEDLDEEKTMVDHGPQWFQLFLYWLAGRREIELGLETLHLVRCRFSQGYIDRLKALSRMSFNTTKGNNPSVPNRVNSHHLPLFILISI